MRKIFATVLFITMILLNAPRARAEGGIFASGGGSKTAGTTFTVTVSASGATFDSLQGVISVSGPVDVVSFSAGGATWLPGKTPSNGGQFVGIVSARNSLTVATIKLRGRAPGGGAVSVSGVKLASSGAVVGTGAGGASFTITRALVLPAAPTVASSTHPDPNTPYEATDVALSWNKDSGVTGFSYAWDQAPTTEPAKKALDANTTITYSSQPIGQYYFHIRAQNGDGWSNTSHFKVSIKEPDAKINELLKKPSNISIKKSSNFVNDITGGKVTGVIISGQTEAGYTANIKLDPSPTLPEGKTLTALANASGLFELNLDYPIPAGRYSLTVQGQKEKVLTPLSDITIFEISQVNGGAIHILTEKDAREIINKTILKWYEKINYRIASYVLLGLFITTLGLLIWQIIRYKKKLR